MKRYSTEKEILDDIDKKKAQAVRFIRSAEKLEDKAKELFTQYAQCEEAKELKKLASQRRTRANNIMEKKLPVLKNALSQMKTRTFFFAADESVVVK